jgi:hypothetical protein
MSGEPIRIEEWAGVRQPVRIYECECGEEIPCYEFTNTCAACGRDYNMSGTLLAPRSQWGEETGESWRDCY